MIPKKIHQTYLKSDHRFFVASNNIKYLNKDHQYYFYDDNDCYRYIKTYYGHEYSKAWLSINPNYGAAKADFFRYLLMYREGGIYLDIKAGCDFPFSEMLKESDSYILSYWDKTLYPGEDTIHKGFWNKNSSMWDFGEFMQWFIICEPRHPFLLILINKVLNNIKNYDGKFEYLGKFNIYVNTGPIVYSNIIDPLINKYSNRVVNIERDLGIHYSPFLADFSHEAFYDNKHYSKINEPLVLK